MFRAGSKRCVTRLNVHPHRSACRSGAALRLEVLEDRTLLSFVGGFEVQAGKGPVAVTAADFTGSGTDGLAAADQGNTVSVLLTVGNGQATAYATGPRPSDVVAAPVSGGPRPDLVTANAGGSNVSVLHNNGDGTFRSAANYAVPAGALAVAAGDVNGDGQPDLAVVNGQSVGAVSVLLNNGNGTFAAAVCYSTGASPEAVAIGDINGDGRPDLITVNRANSTVSFLLGNGNGTFRTAINRAAAASPKALAAADFNGDGHLDLALANSGSNTVTLLLGNGNGTFHNAGNLVIDAEPAVTATAITAGHLTNSRHMDLVVGTNFEFGGPVGHTASVLLGNGDGTFQPAVEYGVGNTPTSVTVGDFRGDGKTDLALATGYYNGSRFAPVAVSVLPGNGDGTFPSTPAYTTGGFDPLGVAVADVNGDGTPDLLVANYSTGSVGVLLGNGDGTFGNAVNYSTGMPGLQNIAVADFNGDGKADFIAAGNDLNDVWVFLNNGDGTFKLLMQRVWAMAPYSMAVGDFNGDGKLDIAESDIGFGPSTVSVALGNGDGTFQPSVTLAGKAVRISSVAVADVNGDGKLDIVTTNDSSSTNPSVAVRLGNGDGTFDNPVNFATWPSPQSVAVGDVDGDGKPDLVVGTATGVEVLLGNGDGAFRAPLNYLSGLPANFVTLADINGDGPEEVVALTPAGAVVLLGNGHGGLQPPTTSSIAGISVFAAAVGDFNGDGRLDVAVTNPVFDTVSVLLNRPGPPAGLAAPSAGQPPMDSTAPAFGDSGQQARAQTPTASPRLAEQPADTGLDALRQSSCPVLAVVWCRLPATPPAALGPSWPTVLSPLEGSDIFGPLALDRLHAESV
jgi:hypothetical protein